MKSNTRELHPPSARRPIFPQIGRRLCGVVAVATVALGAASGARADLVTSAANFLLTIQDGSSGFFVDDPPCQFHVSTQGQMGLGVLNAYVDPPNNHNPIYLNSATKLGNALLDPGTALGIDLNLPANATLKAQFFFGNGDPIIYSQTTLFYQRLSQASGDPQYATFLKNNFWDKLAGGTYQMGGDAAGYGAAIRGACGPISAWCLAKPAVAAHEANEAAIQNVLMLQIVQGLNDQGSAADYDVLGLAGAAWAAAVTGFNLDPTTGIWASINSTQDAILALLALQNANGGFLYKSDEDLSILSNLDAETTGFAVLALASLGEMTYADAIARGLAFLESLQLPSGQILGYPGAGTGFDESPPSVHADVLQTYAETVPEPGTIALFGAGLLGLAGLGLRRRVAA